jgi:hypothetical protein
MIPRYSILAVAALAAPLAFATTSPSAGWLGQTVTAAPGGSFLGGMDWLPNGHVAIFDGTSIVELDPTNGNVVATLYTPAGFVFGSFVKVAPGGAFLLFGESSNQTITKVPLDGSAPSVVATVVYNYDLTFENDRVAFVSAAPVWGQAQIVRLDIASGAVDLIADFLGASGALAFDASGTLYYGEAAASFPQPFMGQDIVAFDAAQVAGAIGPTFLTELDATPIVSGFTSINDIVVDAQGDLIVAYDILGFPTPNYVSEYAPNGVLKNIITQSGPGGYLAPLAYRKSDPGAPSTFSPFQREDGGDLAVISTDFFSFVDLDVISPRRATLSTNPAGPIPQGSFTFNLANGPANGTALFLVGSTPTTPEIAVYSGGVAFLFGITPSSVASVVPVSLNANGAFSTSVLNHGSPGVAYIQAALLDNGGYGVATSSPFELTLR